MNTFSRNLNPKTKLALLNNLRKQKGLARGFTLVELMITVAIVGILAAVALPQFLGARNAAAAGSAVGEALGIAKECGVIAASDIGTPPAAAGTTLVSCGSTGGTVTGTWASGDGVGGVKCLAATAADGDTTATITIAADGGLTCSFS